MKAIELTTSEKLHSQSEAGQIFGQTEKLYAFILCESLQISSNLSKIGGTHLQYLCYQCAKFA